MRQSLLFTKTSKTAPKDEVSKNASLLIRAGFVYKEMAGVYSYLPLGLRVIEKIKNIIREEMNREGGQEMIMTALQDPNLWKKTDRWDDEKVDVWFKSKLKNETEVGFGWSHEEPILAMIGQYVPSYKDLPVSVYQFQTKLRNELRAKSGIMRGREFVMKDMYSLHASQEDCDRYYQAVTEAYRRCFARLGIGESTFLTFASGGAFTKKFSHEFQTLCEAGEDVLYRDKEKSVAVNEEVLEKAAHEIGLNKEDLTPEKSAEVGNIFQFGTEKSEQMGVYFTDREGQKKPAYLASYGIGITRVMGVIVEKFADEKGIVWPESIAPFQVHLLALGGFSEAEKIYEQLTERGIEVLYDDREARAGEKFADADLIGIPHRVVVGKSFAEEGKLEYKYRTKGEVELLSLEEVLGKVASE
jgi:prolyl-tRNA synthetase